LTEPVLELYGHSRRVGLIEWHPTTSGILFSAGYDYKVITSFETEFDSLKFNNMSYKVKTWTVGFM